eukprot:15131832-Alexandrium_andersonii.AAC.1
MERAVACQPEAPPRSGQASPHPQARQPGSPGGLAGEPTGQSPTPGSGPVSSPWPKSRLCKSVRACVHACVRACVRAC